MLPILPKGLPSRQDVHDEPPPFLGTWTRVYAGVLIYLTLLITALYVLTCAFAPQT